MIWEEMGWPSGEMSTESVVETGKEKLCEGFDPPAKKLGLESVFLLVCGTDLVDVEEVESCALGADQGPSL